MGVNIPNMPQPAKKEAYQADILYGTNNEFGFDYLRDNMAFRLKIACNVLASLLWSMKWTRS